MNEYGFPFQWRPMRNDKKYFREILLLFEVASFSIATVSVPLIHGSRCHSFPGALHELAAPAN